jgi:hypothetical protein
MQQCNVAFLAKTVRVALALMAKVASLILSVMKMDPTQFQLQRLRPFLKLQPIHITAVLHLTRHLQSVQFHAQENHLMNARVVRLALRALLVLIEVPSSVEQRGKKLPQLVPCLAKVD